MSESELKNRISILEGRLKRIDNGQILNRTIDPPSKNVITDVIRDSIYDIIWDEYFYYHTFFESLDRASSTGTGGTTTINSTGLVLETGGTSANNRVLSLNVDNSVLFSFTKNSRFRTACMIESVTQLDNQTTYIMSNLETGVSQDGYGFKISGSTISGLVMKAGSETTKSLGTFPNATMTKLEARYYAGNRVVFYVDGVEKGGLTTGLPALTGLPEMLYYFKITTSENETKILTVQDFEYIQER